ncbi:MAG: hypothetical protein RJA22_1647 [Verrucomicrobiota bacterium]
MFAHPLARLLAITLVTLTLAGSALAQSSHLQVLSANGKAKVLYQGSQVWSGPVQGTASARSRSVNGKDYAAAFDGDKVLWENVPGAAKQVGNPGEPSGFSMQRTLRRNRNAVDDNQRQLEEMLKELDEQAPEADPAKPGAKARSGGTAGGQAITRGGASGQSSSTLSMSVGTDGTVTRTNGVTTLRWKGKTIPLGRTAGPLSFKSSNVNGSESVTLLEGDRVLWQSTSKPAK